MLNLNLLSFSPRNGEVILKEIVLCFCSALPLFQSPQWGSNSKEDIGGSEVLKEWFQSPQWGSNSKVISSVSSISSNSVSVPAMGK